MTVVLFLCLGIVVGLGVVVAVIVAVASGINEIDAAESDQMADDVGLFPRHAAEHDRAAQASHLNKGATGPYPISSGFDRRA